MSRFKKGESGNPSGRPKGAKNKANEKIKGAVAQLVEGQLESLQKSFEKLAQKNPEAHALAVTRLLEFTIPKLSRVDGSQIEKTTLIDGSFAGLMKLDPATRRERIRQLQEEINNQNHEE